MLEKRSAILVSYYDILGVSVHASTQEVRKAFREKARFVHPDVNHNPTAHSDFQRLNEAYQVLANRNKRQLYDLRQEHGIAYQRTYYQPGNVYYREKGNRYASRTHTSPPQSSPFEKFEKFFDFFLFLSLSFTGIFSLLYGLYRLVIHPAENLNPFPAIVLGIIFTLVMLLVGSKRIKVFEGQN